MNQPQLAGVQCLTAKVLQGFPELVGDPFGNFKASTVDIITHYRVFKARHMDANLVGASGLEFKTDIAVPGKALQYPVVSARLFTIADNGHFHPLPRMPADRLVYQTTAGHSASNHRFIFTADCARL